MMMLGVLRAAARVMLFAGLSALLASVVALATLAASGAARTVAGIALCAGAVLVAAAGGAIYLSRPRGWRLPNERLDASDADRPALDGPLILLAIVLAALPVWLLVRLGPFLREWRYLLDVLAEANVWRDLSSPAGAILVLPLSAALSPPFVELLALLGFVAGPVILLGSLLLRSPRFPRAYLVWIVLMSALVVVSALGAYLVSLAGVAVETLIRESQPRPEEALRLREALGRYSVAVIPTAPVLAWTLAGYLIWLPYLIRSTSVAAIFANPRLPAAPPRPDDLAAITKPDGFPGH